MFSFLSNPGTFVAFLALVAGFGFIIFIHELGHFLAAKWVGIKVTQFAVGFGQSMLTWRKGIGFRVGSTEAEYEKRLNAKLAEQNRAGEKLDATQEAALAQSIGLGETEYRLNWIPLGGYVKMLGQEDLNPGATSMDPRSFNAKPVWARAVVVSAGVVMNLLSAVVFFIVAFMAGVAFPPAIAGPVLPGTPAALAYAVGHDGNEAYRGLQPGDEIISINDKPMGDFMEVAVTSALSAPQEKLRLKVQRQSLESPLFFDLVARPDRHSNLLSLGILPPRTLELQEKPIAGRYAMPDLKLPANALEADGRPLSSFTDYYHIITAAKGRPVTVTFSEKGNPENKTNVQIAAVPLLSPRKNAQGESTGIPDLLGMTLGTSVAGLSDKPLNSVAKQIGIKPGDIVAQVGNIAWPSRDQLMEYISSAKGQPFHFVVQREGKLVDFGQISTGKDKVLGIGLDFAMDQPIVASVISGTPVDQSLKLTPGSRIISIQGQPVSNWADMQRLFAEAAAKLPQEGGSISVTYQLNMAGDIEGTGQIVIDEAERKRLLDTQWVPPLVDYFGDLRLPLVADSITDAAVLGVVKTKHYMMQTYVTLLRLFQGTVKASHLRGPVGIASEGTRVAKLGWTYLLFFLGLISVNLAVINFLPIPVVDGGLMVFLIMEKIKGSPVSMRVQNAATIVGLTLILSIFVITLFYDISRLIG